ncbi:MAG: hypothetical protein H7Y89_19520 [Steroidobacteraceae bacterium]|nr:hypothetical protein [Steroidobacteraceae bacterium]
MSTVVRSRFYPLAAAALAAFVLVGFSRTYYLRLLSDLPPMTGLVHLHGLVFTAWLGLFFAQTRFIAAHRVDLHRKLGIAGLALAAIVIAVGFATVAVKANEPRIHPSGLTPPQFTIVGSTSLALFAVFLGLGVAFRRRAALHRRFMMLAMIAVLTPASSRILTLLGLREYWSFLTPVLPAGFVVWCLARDWMRERIVHPVYAIGGIAITLAWPFRLIAGRAEWYQPVGEWIARVGAGLVSA